MMHRSTTSPRFQSSDWTKAILYSKQHILCYVGTGWFSLACRRARNWPFWSHSVFLYPSECVGVLQDTSPALYHPRMSCILARMCSAFSQSLDVD